MGVYVLTNGKGSYIYRDETSGKYVPIKSFKKATQWDNDVKPIKILNNCISKEIRNDYMLQLVEVNGKVQKGASVQNSVCRSICSHNVTENSIDEWFSNVKNLVDVIDNSNTQHKELSNKLSNVDKEIVDVEHYIEFGKFNAYQGWMCFKMLQNLLQQRRKYKNEIQVLNLVKQCKFDKKSLKNLSQAISDIQNKHYMPRAFPELFSSNEQI